MADLAFIDTSGYQHPGGAAIDWNAVKASGRSGVYVKLSEGTALDPYGQKDVRDARAAGLHVGVYHFARPDLGSATSEAAAFNSYRAGLPTDCPPCLDSERQPITQQWNDEFAALVQDELGYTFRSARGTLSLPDSRIWIAAPGAARGDYLGVQYGTGNVPGVTVPVDFDWFDPAIVQGDTAMGGCMFKPGTYELHWHFINQDRSIGHGWLGEGSGPVGNDDLGGTAIGEASGAWSSDGQKYSVVVTGVDHQIYIRSYTIGVGWDAGWFPTGTYDYPPYAGAPGPEGPPGPPGAPGLPPPTHDHNFSGTTASS